MSYYKIFKKVIFHLFNGKISSGPFKGMRYVNTAHGSAFLPKIVGTYEREIQDYIWQIVNHKYKVVIDVGAAEGYYAVGLAYLYKKKGYSAFKVWAFDSNTAAHPTLRKLAALNEVEDYIEVGTVCSHAKLNSLLTGNNIIICDIEGGETALLDPSKVQALHFCDMLVELHDGKEDHITNEFKLRFKDSHKISVINFKRRNYNDGPKWLIISKFRLATVREGRTKGLKWMFLEQKEKVH